MNKRLTSQKNTGNILRQELNENKNVLGDMHPETVKSYQKLIQYLFVEQQNEECLKVIEVIVKLYENELDKTIFDCHQFRNKQACLMKDYQVFIDILLKVHDLLQSSNQTKLEIINKLLVYLVSMYTENSKQYTSNLLRKARVLLNKNEKLQSMSCLEHCLSIQNRILNKQDVEFGSTYMMIGEILQQYGLFEEALTHYYMALNIYDGQNSDENIQSAHIRVQISTILYFQNKVDESNEMLTQAFKIYNEQNLLKFLPQDLQIYSAGLFQYSINLRDQGYFEKALQYATLDKDIKQQNNFDILESCENLGQIYYLKGEIKKSKEFYEVVLQKIKIMYDKEPENQKTVKQYVNILNQLLLISQILDQNTDALRYQKEKQQIMMRLNFKRAKQKIQSRNLKVPFKQNLKQLDSFPSFSSLQTTKLPSIMNLQDDTQQTSRSLKYLQESPTQVLFRHSISNFNFNEHPTSTTLFNRSMSLLVQPKQNNLIRKQQTLQSISFQFQK
ncbi:hypothetical protein ABPG74_010934 [Tetrahymena malaccensis]